MLKCDSFCHTHHIPLHVLQELTAISGMLFYFIELFISQSGRLFKYLIIYKKLSYIMHGRSQTETLCTFFINAHAKCDYP